MLLDGRLKFRIVRSVNLAFFLTLEEQYKARFARQWAILQVLEDLLWDIGQLGAEKLHLVEVFVESHMQRSEVLLHSVASAEERQMQVDACTRARSKVNG